MAQHYTMVPLQTRLVLRFRRDPPAEFFVGLVVPERDQSNRDQVRNVAVHMEQVEFDVENHDVEENAERTDRVELQKALQSLSHGLLFARDVAKCPKIVPDEV